MKHRYYIVDPEKVYPLFNLKMLSSRSFTQETLEDGTKIYGSLEFNGELSTKCIELCGVKEMEETKCTKN